MFCFQLSSDPPHRGTKETFEEAGDQDRGISQNSETPKWSFQQEANGICHADYFETHPGLYIYIYIQFLGRFQSRYSKIISARQCLCILIGRGAEECKLVLFTRLGYVLQYPMCLIQQVL